MRFQERDGLILLTIFAYGGILARRHLHDMFWRGATLRAMLKRLSLLVKFNFLDRPNIYHWRSVPVPEAIYWVGWRGAQWLAEQRGIEVDPPRNTGENQMRIFHRNLRVNGLHWLREPKWDKLRHDLLVVDFRLALERAVWELPAITLEQWILESEFRSNMDRVEFKTESKGGEVEHGERGVCPDGFFILTNEERKSRGEHHRLPCLLEVDMATHDNPSFGREKVAPYAAYVHSPAYKARFGLNSGIWLVVTSGERRMRNLMRQTEVTVGHDGRLFFFTTKDKPFEVNVLTSPIWWRIGQSEPESLIKI